MTLLSDTRIATFDEVSFCELSVERPSLERADFAQLHHRPVGVDGDVGAVVVEDGAGAVDDFLVALDLRHDLLLHLQRRQGDLDLLDDLPFVMMTVIDSVRAG